MEGPLILHIGLLLGGIWLLVASIRYWNDYRKVPPPAQSGSTKNGEMLAAFGAMGAAVILAIAMITFGLIGIVGHWRGIL